jgi:hypothetical protein
VYVDFLHLHGLNGNPILHPSSGIMAQARISHTHPIGDYSSLISAASCETDEFLSPHVIHHGTVPEGCSFTRHRANGSLPVVTPIYKVSSILTFTLTLTVAFSFLDLHLEFPVSTPLFPSITLPRSGRQLIHLQNVFHMSTIYNNMTYSGQGLKPVRRFLNNGALVH